MRDNAKALFTKMRILSAIDEPIDLLSVADICAKAGVSRQTFYNHFKSKYSIFSWWSECCEPIYLDKIGFQYTWEEGTLRHTRLIYSMQDVLGPALSQSHTQALTDEIVARRRDRVLAALNRRNVDIDELMEFCVGQYAYEVTRTATNIAKLNVNKKIGLVMTAKMGVATVPAPLYDALQLPAYKGRSQTQGIAHIDVLARSVLNEPEPDIFSLISATQLR